MAGWRRPPHRVEGRPIADTTTAVFTTIVAAGALAVMLAVLTARVTTGQGVTLLLFLIIAAMALSMPLLSGRVRYVEFRHKSIMVGLPVGRRRIPATDIWDIRFQFREYQRWFYQDEEDPKLLIPHEYELVVETANGAPLHVLKDAQFERSVTHLLPYVAHLYQTREEYLRTQVFLDDPHRLFGTDSAVPFADYFYGKSTVRPSKVQGINEFLWSCELRPHLGRRGQWQHPLDFERRRTGNEKDHALWAWRRLVELGFEAQLVRGRRRRAPGSWEDHTWVSFYDGSRQLYVLDASSKDRDATVMPEVIARSTFVPHVDVDRRQKTFQHPVNIVGDPRYHDQGP
ncbi:MAG: hypothetical protein AAF962_25930 [Actinomycetota bacterium]